jgi:hypothetical protein
VSDSDGEWLCYRRGACIEEPAEALPPPSRLSRRPLVRIGLHTIASFAVTSEMRYEFRIVTAERKRPWLFRAGSRAQLDLWTRVLHELLSLHVTST